MARTLRAPRHLGVTVWLGHSLPPVEYGRLIGGAYRIALHNWRLWPFGVFAGTAGFSFNFQFDTGDESFPDIDLDLFLVLVLVVAALALGAIVLSVLSQGALAESVAAISRGEERDFRQALRAGRAAFWRIAGLYLLLALLALMLVLAVALVAGGAVWATSRPPTRRGCGWR